MKYLFISGMFRSGTTLIARMLSTHPKIAVSSDPSLPLFKFFRSSLFKKIGLHVPPNNPLEDYYFSIYGMKYIENLISSNLNLEIDENLNKLKQEIKKYSEPYAPKVVGELNSLTGKTYSEVLESLLSIIRKVYTSMGKSPEVVGMKEVWANEFVLPLYNTYDEFLFIELVRDPRAVSASKNVQKDKYPWLFLSRQWRKLGTFSLMHSKRLPSERYMLIRYEDLIRFPKDSAKKICEFLGVEFIEDMIDPSKFKDESGNPWIQNTSWDKPKRAFDIEAIDRWKRVLSEKERKFIEALCAPEMIANGYELKWDIKELNNFIDYLTLEPFDVDNGSLANWIKDFYAFEEVNYSIEMSKELIRYKLLEIGKDTSIKEKIVKSAFLFKEVYENLREVCQHG